MTQTRISVRFLGSAHRGYIDPDPLCPPRSRHSPLGMLVDQEHDVAADPYIGGSSISPGGRGSPSALLSGEHDVDDRKHRRPSDERPDSSPSDLRLRSRHRPGRRDRRGTRAHDLRRPRRGQHSASASVPSRRGTVARPRVALLPRLRRRSGPPNHRVRIQRRTRGQEPAIVGLGTVPAPFALLGCSELEGRDRRRLDMGSRSLDHRRRLARLRGRRIRSLAELPIRGISS